MQKVLISIVGIIIGLLLISGVLLDTITDVISEDYSEPFSVTTGAGVTSTNETLSYASFYEDLTGLEATSDNEDDTPVVMAYDEDDYIVTVAGLHAADSRILTIGYVREAHNEFTGFSPLARMLPFLLGIGLFIAGIWGIFSAWKSRG